MTDLLSVHVLLCRLRDATERMADGAAIPQQDRADVRAWTQQIESALLNPPTVTIKVPSPEEIQRRYLERKPLRRLVLVGCRRSTADEFKAAHDLDNDGPTGAA